VRRQLVLFCTALFLGNGISGSTQSQTQSSTTTAAIGSGSKLSSDPITIAIQKVVVASVVAFNKRDAQASAAFWTKDGEYVDESGQAVAIEAYFTEIFTARPESKLQLATDSIRLRTDSVAIEDGPSIVEPSPNAPAEDGTVTMGLQMIGWNARANHIQSWNIAPDGGHAIDVSNEITPIGACMVLRGMFSTQVLGRNKLDHLCGDEAKSSRPRFR
jgi:uncharacterized protein (TIGR02246 family)